MKELSAKSFAFLLHALHIRVISSSCSSGTPMNMGLTVQCRL